MLIIGIDAATPDRDTNFSMASTLAYSKSRTSAKWPVIAAATAMPGLTK
jgi:hypothetical protein